MPPACAAAAAQLPLLPPAASHSTRPCCAFPLPLAVPAWVSGGRLVTNEPSERSRSAANKQRSAALWRAACPAALNCPAPRPCCCSSDMSRRTFQPACELQLPPVLPLLADQSSVEVIEQVIWTGWAERGCRCWVQARADQPQSHALLPMPSLQFGKFSRIAYPGFNFVWFACFIGTVLRLWYFQRAPRSSATPPCLPRGAIPCPATLLSKQLRSHTCAGMGVHKLQLTCACSQLTYQYWLPLQVLHRRARCGWPVAAHPAAGRAVSRICIMSFAGIAYPTAVRAVSQAEPVWDVDCVAM